MILVDIKSRVPIYEQIIASVKEAVITGLLSADEPLPSVRSLAGELAINPNTIQKAYSELERQGIVYSVPGKGSFVSSDTEEIEKQHRKLIKAELKKKISEAFKAGLTAENILEIIKKTEEEK
ncbi:MAG: GntR family transcriptional regulator [Ruminococcaceae bacterium]|nr:GntR family transcriptional regulator [Oscillospiraceae bacterium]